MICSRHVAAMAGYLMRERETEAGEGEKTICDQQCANIAAMNYEWMVCRQ